MKNVEIYISRKFAGIAQLVERNLAKVEVAGSNPVSRSSLQTRKALFSIGLSLRQGSQVVRQRSAKPLFAGSIPAPASSLRFFHSIRAINDVCRDGGIGRHTGLKIPRILHPCGFDSRSRYQTSIPGHPIKACKPIVFSTANLFYPHPPAYFLVMRRWSKTIRVREAICRIFFTDVFYASGFKRFIRQMHPFGFYALRGF